MYRDVTIGAGGTTSAVAEAPVGLFGEAAQFLGIIMPAAFTGSTVSFQVSDDYDKDAASGNFYGVYDSSGSLVALTVGTSRFVTLTAIQYQQIGKFRWLKVVSASTEGSARSLRLVWA
jgi:hypothetical protein